MKYKYRSIDMYYHEIPIIVSNERIVSVQHFYYWDRYLIEKAIPFVSKIGKHHVR